MKRQHPPDDDEDGRGKPKAREDQAQALDLNATPRGFDLNAPFSEEEGQEWIAGSGQEDALHREIFKQHLEPAADLGIDEELDILHSIWSAWTQENWQRLDEILESVLDEISRFPSSPPRYQYLTCFYISKKLPNAFCLPRTYKILLSFLDSSPSEASTKKQNFLPGFSCKLLFRAFNEKPEWPLEFVQAYLDDAINLRNWVDSEHCKEFVANILTSFDEDLTVGTEDPSDVKGDTAQCSLKNRYPGDEIRQKAKAEFMQALNHLLKVPLIKENPRILRMLTLGVNYEEVRVIASSMMEGWLNTPFHFRRAKLLLDRVLHFTNGTTMKDFETVANILSLRLNQGVSQMKNASTSFYTELVIQIVQKRPEYSSLALKTFLTAELNSTGPHNMKGISVVLKALPDSLSPERALALVIKELVLSDDHVGRLQEAVTRVLKQLKEISPCLLCRALLEPWDSILQQQDSARQSWFKQVIELSCHFLIQAATPFSSDEKFLVAISATGKRSRDESLKEILPLFKDLSMKIMTFQEEALTWCVDVLSSQLSAGDCNFFTTAVQKLMFLEPVEEYNLSSSSGTVELNSFQLVAFSMHASEEVLARIILMGISNQFPMQQEDALHIIEKLVWRAAASDKHAFGTLFADSLQLPAAIMKLSSFYLPSVSRQPLPQLVIKDLYWRSCLVIIVIAAYNPATIGKSVWENFPSVRYLLQYLITEGTKSGLSAADILEDKEAVLNDIKAEEILDSFLIKELECEPTNAMEPWKGNIMLLNTQTNRRKPPTYILEELKDIEPSYDLGRRIRSCTEPSFLCNTVSSQDFKEAWEWIQKVAGKQPEVLGMLPCDWQCKLLYRFIFQAAKSPIHDFLHNLRKLFSEDKASEGDAVSVMKFLSDKLVSRNSHVRACGRKCISGIMNGMVSKTADPTVDIYAQSAEFTWLEALEIAKQAATVSSAIQEALQYESSIDVVWAYLKFLKKQLSTSSLAYLSARLLVSRKLLASSLLSTSAKEIISGWNGENTFPILEFFLDAFNTVCTQPLSKWDDVPGSLVKLFSKRHDGTVFHMEIPNIVVEAMVKLLGFIGSSENESPREMVSYENIVQFLLPGFLAKDGDLSMAYIELSTGEKLSILSKEQQDCLISTKDARLVKAGLMDMDARLKVDALINLHVSVEARECLLEELSRLSESSVKNILQPLSTWERLWISGCFPKIEEPGTSPFLKSICELKENSGPHSDTLIGDIIEGERANDFIAASLISNMPEIVELKVAMSCQGCVGAVKRVLGKLEGVDNFEIDLKEQKVSVTTSSLKPEQVLEAVSKSGKATSYWPEPPKGDANPPKEVPPKEVAPKEVS